MVEGIVEVGQTVYIAAKRAAKPRSMSKAIRVYPICSESSSLTSAAATTWGHRNQREEP